MRPMTSQVVASTIAIAGAAPISSATYSLPFAKARSPGCDPGAISTVATTLPDEASQPRIVFAARFATHSVPFTLRCSPGPATATDVVANATTRARATNVRAYVFISPPCSGRDAASRRSRANGTPPRSHIPRPSSPSTQDVSSTPDDSRDPGAQAPAGRPQSLPPTNL